MTNISVIFQFHPVPDEIERLQDDLRHLLDDVVAHELYFRLRMPMRFTVAGRDLFWTSTDGWQEVSLLSVAMGLHDLVEVARCGGSVEFDLDEYGWILRVTGDGDNIVISHFMWSQGDSVRIPYSTLSAAYRQFATEVRTYLISQLPELRDFPVVEYRTWVRGESYDPWREPQ